MFSDQLEVGMFVSDLDRDWSDTNFLMQGFTVQAPSDIAAVKSQCDYVYVDFDNEIDYKRFRSKNTASPTLKARLQKEVNEVSIQDEIGPAKSHYNTSKTLMKGVLDKILLGKDFDIAAVKQQVKHCVQSIIRNENALLMLSLLKHKDEYTAEHCLNVGILSIAFARFLGFDEEQLEDIGLAGMLHDIGKVKVPPEILNKPGRLTEEEFQIMRDHAKFGYEILLSKKDVAGSTIDVAYSHHERLNGKGYPRGLFDQQISTYSRIVSIVDCFDAITSDRCYDNSRSILDAYKILMENRDSHFDAKMVEQFIEWRGIYPPGSIVEMHNGEVGIVLATNPRYKLKPKVLLVLNEDKNRHAKERIIDMSKIDLDAQSKPYRVVKAIPNRAYGVDIQTYVDKGLKIAAA